MNEFESLFQDISIYVGMTLLLIFIWAAFIFTLLIKIWVACGDVSKIRELLEDSVVKSENKSDSN